MKVAIYTRVSTADQDCSRQTRELSDYATRCGWEVLGIFSEKESGIKCDRSQRAKIIELAKNRQIDAVLVSELSRWSRSLTDLLGTLKSLTDWGISLKCLNGFEVDLSSAMGKLIVTLLGAIAEFERELINERIRSGLDNAKARGQKLGRREGMSNRVKRLSPKVRSERESGRSIRWLAKEYQLSTATIQKILRES